MSSRKDWLIPASLIALSLVPALAGTARLVQLGAGARVTPENARFFAAPVPVSLHITAAILYSILGAFQFSPGFRRRNRRWHRVVGRVLLPCATIVAMSGLWMTLTYPWPAGDGVLVYLERLVFGTAMLMSIALGVDAIRRRRFATHGDWMIRAYAIAMGAGTQVLTHLPWFILVNGKPGEGPRAVMMGAGWVINVIVAEWIIRSSVRQTNTSQPAHSAPNDSPRWRWLARNGAVRLAFARETSRGVPDATTRPPSSPAPGPMSMT
jgi:uncharacterized membrane protein